MFSAAAVTVLVLNEGAEAWRALDDLAGLAGKAKVRVARKDEPKLRCVCG